MVMMTTLSPDVTTAVNGSSITKEDDTEWTIPVVIAMLSTFSVIGTIGNVLVLYVFGRRKEKLTSTLFIIALACTDLLSCVVIMPYTIAVEALQYQIEYDLLCKFYNFLITSSIPCSAFIMVAIAVDRYFCICHPFMHAMTICRAKIILVCLALFAISLGITTSLAFGTYKEQDHPFSSYTQNITLNNSMVFEKLTLKVHTGQCGTNTFIISDGFRGAYQMFYSSLYLISVIIVFILYGLILHSVVSRRAARQRQKSGNSMHCDLVQSGIVAEEPTQMTVLNGNGVNDHQRTDSQKEKKKMKKHKISGKMLDKNRVANLKTAGMLFVVAIVFIFLFLPAWLLALGVFEFNHIVFYMYFSYNVANPVIYAFMNQSFRDDLKELFHCKPSHN